jgi:hypothetical protein
MYYVVKVRKGLSLFIVFCVFLFQFSGLLGSQTLDRGNLIGYIFDRDGTTPMVGAVAKLKNITSGSIYVSPETDRAGLFRIQGLGKGIYTYGITTPRGDFNSNELIGILANETTKVSISLNTYDTVVQSAVQEVLRGQAEPAGESRIGRVLTYNPAKKEALVFVEKGILQVDDSVHVLGIATNFTQDVPGLMIGSTAVKRALAGQETWMKTTRAAMQDDIVYVTCKRGVVPFFLTPCGIAWVIAGSGAILAGIIETTPKHPVSPFTVQK